MVKQTKEDMIGDCYKILQEKNSFNSHKLHVRQLETHL